jgi:uncharacterized protein (DUF924 family)
MEKIEKILNYWFDDVDMTALPSAHLKEKWFMEKPDVDQDIKDKFYPDFLSAAQGNYDDWADTPRGCLSLIILLDQFSRHIYRGTAQAFAQDDKALQLCLMGIDRQYDHMLSLTERAFFYFPLMHAENSEMQYLALRAYDILNTLSFPEARILFEKLLNDAIHRNDMITKYGRFPGRNAVLGRISTPEEEIFLNH